MNFLFGSALDAYTILNKQYPSVSLKSGVHWFSTDINNVGLSKFEKNVLLNCWNKQGANLLHLVSQLKPSFNYIDKLA